MDRENLEKIMNSNKLTMSEKMEAIKEEMKVLLREYSYLDLFKKLKASRLSKKSKDLYLNLYDQALEELLEEKRKGLSLEEADKVLDYLQEETNKTRRFIEETEKALLSPEKVTELSKKVPASYKELAKAEADGNLEGPGKSLLDNENLKLKRAEAELYSKMLLGEEGDMSRHYSSEVKKNTK